MKVSRFLSYFRTTALRGLALAALCGATFTMTSCSGGGDSEAGYIVTAEQFAAGKGFYIMANNLWTLHATDTAGLIQPPTEVYTGTVACRGEITAGDYDNEDAGRATVLFSYTYNKDTNKGKLEWSWDSTNDNNVPTASLAFFTTPHNLAGGADNGNNNNGNNNEEQMGGIGEEGNPNALAEHFKQAWLELDFAQGTCIFHCPCGADSQVLKFYVRAN